MRVAQDRVRRPDRGRPRRTGLGVGQRPAVRRLVPAWPLGGGRRNRRRYPLRETPEPSPAQRTEWNVRDSDGTLIVNLAKRLIGGTRLTEDLTMRLAKPHLVLAKEDGELPVQAAALRQFIAANNITVLNIAGPRASGDPGIGAQVTSLLDAALSQVQRWVKLN